MKPKIYVTRRLPQPALDRIQEVFEMAINPDDRVLTKAEIVANVRGQDALLCLLTDTIDAEIMDAEKNLRVLSNYAVGYNNVDVEAATARKLPVTNTPGVLTETSADLAFTLILSVARRVAEADKFTRDGKFHGWGPMMLLGHDVYGKTLGIVGLGRIGLATARRARGFGMNLLYASRTPKPEAEAELGASRVELDDLLTASDFVSVHVPLSDETTHVIGAREIGLMKPTAFLINTARGPIVDEAALVVALRAGDIAGAGLDVYESEPALEPGLVELENTVLLPHVASATIETRTKMAMLAAENAIAVIEGRTPAHLVNPEALDRA
ncbi:D-glycerate dehydrogenase [Candidatus Poribacteria bacterium]|nr:D-glycerate dehydrogenase [Candidatus Poribacteria bacterium]MBT5533146.1 D-glycerate dehydrogenase [Candidatus Poribacteria bacterium]MBT5713324.1 D-glycerate dehydrogenase [Candidatus Poribacteria bacterium]MBT7096721.1 D-glycerate dehydrogenase [Candidatus Poribacteria bacterium]MBT7806298.1 D-glycerate dehydrogenase [Candidatus Poribacteria bacterium]